MSQTFGRIPAGVLRQPDSFTLRIPDEDIENLETILRLSKIGPPTWTNQHEDGYFGITRQWLINARNVWLNDFNWRAQEERINSVPNFRMTIHDPNCGDFSVHFAALFSTCAEATPIILMHGWPGSFIEFIPIMEILATKYSPETLPYHVIVPSLPAYGLSSHAPLHKKFTLQDSARILHLLMVQLGFGTGYIAQGGDVGSIMANIMATNYAECKAFHVNMLIAGQLNYPLEGLSAKDLSHLERTKIFRTLGGGYSLEHATRPATIGLVLSSSPLALLAWIGEKLLEWVDEPLSLTDILTDASLYWYTSTISGAITSYHFIVEERSQIIAPKTKPLGFSSFPRELSAVPIAWAKKAFPNLQFYKEHEKGGHFAALEQPEAFLADVEEFIDKVGRAALSH